MPIFENEKIRKIIQDYYQFSDEHIRTMMVMYYDTLNRLILDESMLYIEDNHLPEEAKLLQLLQESKPYRGEIATEAKLIKFVAEIPNKYPDLQELLKLKVAQLDEGLMHDFIDNLDHDTGIKILQIINDDLDEKSAVLSKYLTK